MKIRNGEKCFLVFFLVMTRLLETEKRRFLSLLKSNAWTYCQISLSRGQKFHPVEGCLSLCRSLQEDQTIAKNKACLVDFSRHDHIYWYMQVNSIASCQNSSLSFAVLVHTEICASYVVGVNNFYPWTYMLNQQRSAFTVRDMKGHGGNTSSGDCSWPTVKY